jgi:CII-binding regulator of phage lambda lysogenization HflD
VIMGWSRASVHGKVLSLSQSFVCSVIRSSLHTRLRADHLWAGVHGWKATRARMDQSAVVGRQLRL